jgi:WhiB family redox-sensing transcriptional regulator
MSPDVNPRPIAGLHAGAPDDWFVDPINLGVPGVRQPSVGADDNQLAWQTDSLCAQTDPEAFFPEKGGSTRDAKRICQTCEVKAQCLEYALANDERFGIWGGLSERERRKLRKQAG